MLVLAMKSENMESIVGQMYTTGIHIRRLVGVRMGDRENINLVPFSHEISTKAAC